MDHQPWHQQVRIIIDILSALHNRPFEKHFNVRDDYKILHMDPDRPNIFFMDGKIKSSLKIGLVEFKNIL